MTESRNQRNLRTLPRKTRAGLFLIGIILLQVMAPLALLATDLDIPLPDGDYVSDQVGLVGDKSRAELKRLNQGLKPSGAQIVVAVIPSLEGQDIERVANQTFRAWGIGDAKKNNGLLLLIAFNDKKFRIEVGRGLEGAIPDGRAGDVLRQDLTPAFKEERYDDGIYEAIRTLAGLTLEEYGGSFDDLDLERPSYLDKASDESEDTMLFQLIILIIFVTLAIRKGKEEFGISSTPSSSSGSSSRSYDYGSSSSSSSSSYDYSSSSSSSRSSSSSSSSSSSYSGGGGSSGGGGASGGW